MEKFYTLMIIPEKNKAVRSIKIPALLIRSFSVVFVLASILISIFVYDYWMILKQIHENRHLNLENRQLREQIQLFQMKVNSLSDDLERIDIFEKKLRVITGLDIETNKEIPLHDSSENPGPMMDDHGHDAAPDEKVNPESTYNHFHNKANEFESSLEYQELKKLYQEKIASNLGLLGQFKVTEKLSGLIKNSLKLASTFSEFDYKFKIYKNWAKEVEGRVHELDQYLLDKDSILRSTPTIIPTKGWITSYFGHRISPTAGVKKMHEGLDVGAPIGTPIYAPADGTVTYAGVKAGFGKFVQIDHGYGVETIYAHSNKILTKNGAQVRRGDLIAEVGNTGYSTGPHLHYEVRVNGIAVDPLYFILN